MTLVIVVLIMLAVAFVAGVIVGGAYIEVEVDEDGILSISWGRD